MYRIYSLNFFTRLTKLCDTRVMAHFNFVRNKRGEIEDVNII